MKNPITLRRERRILAALRACGPLTESELCEFLNIRTRKLGKPLINLAATGQIVCARRTALGGLSIRIWHLPVQADAGDSPTGPRR